MPSLLRSVLGWLTLERFTAQPTSPPAPPPLGEGRGEGLPATADVVAHVPGLT